MNAKVHLGFAHKCHFAFKTRHTSQTDIQNNKLPKTSTRLRFEASLPHCIRAARAGSLDVTYLRGGESVPLTKERRLPRGRSYYPTLLSVDYAALLSLLYLDAFVIWGLPARRPLRAYLQPLLSATGSMRARAPPLLFRNSFYYIGSADTALLPLAAER